MNTFSKKLVVALAAVVAVTMFALGAPAHAQRDAGSKARGDNTPFAGPWPQSRSYSQRSFSYAPAQVTSPQVRQSFSYEPAPFHMGDKIVVSADVTKLMKGTETLATAKRGQTFEVRKIEGPWVGTEMDVNGTKVSGWIWGQHVTLASEPSAAAPERSAVQAPVQRRSFSYEPTYRSYRSYSSPTKEPWQYPKTDPRRFRSH